MEDQSACTGEDLLDVFKALNINLLNVNPNTIRAWFDTDDKNMKSLLEWMCTSLSAKNYVSPLEYDEFSKLENPLKDDKYETEVERIETEHPSIFSIEDTELDIELLEYELEHLDDEEMLLDQALAINRSIQENLSNELNEKSTLEIKTATKLKVTKNKTHELAKNLDAINININSQLEKYGQCINDFMYGTQQTFMLTIEDSCQEKVELLSNSIMPILIRPSDETEDSSMFMESTLWISENSRRDMQRDSVKQRLIQSKLNYIVSKTSLETTSKLFDYLMSVKFESLMLLEPMEEIENKIYLKNGRERVMYSMLENIIVDTTGRQVSNSKLRYLQAALANFQSQLKTITELEDLSVLLLAHYHILLIMCSSQTDDIDFSVQFFKKIFYLSNDLQNCENRIEKMRSTIQMYEAEKPDDKFRFIKHVTRIVFGEEFEAKSGLQKILYLKDTLEDLRYRLFSPEFREERSSFLEMKNDLKTLRSFLVPGPTSEVVLVPIELQKMVQSVREHLERQRRCLRTAVTAVQSRRKLSKWENHRRLLWTYFYSNPQKLLLVLQEIENEVPSVNSNSKMATLIE